MAHRIAPLSVLSKANLCCLKKVKNQILFLAVFTMIKLIIFDLRKTLAYRDVDYSSTSKILEETGVCIPKEEFVKLFESSLQTKKWNDKYEAYKNLCKNMGLVATEENVKLIMEIRDHAEAHTKLYSHTLEMLKRLRELGYYTGLLSNSSVFAIEQIRAKTTLLDYIDYPLFSFDVGLIKPDLSFFKAILQKTACKAEEALMIGNNLKDDILPSQELGMHAIHYQNYEQLKKDLKIY